MTPAELLLKAADLIERPGAWTQGTLVRNSAGHPLLSVSSRRAVCWCAMGAISKVAVDGGGAWKAEMEARYALEKIIGEPLSEFNDAPYRAASEVAEKMREAASTLEAVQ